MLPTFYLVRASWGRTIYTFDEPLPNKRPDQPAPCITDGEHSIIRIRSYENTGILRSLQQH